MPPCFGDFLIPFLRVVSERALTPLRGLLLREVAKRLRFLPHYYEDSVAMSLSAFRRSRFCICSTYSAFRCPSVPYLVRYQRPTEESVLPDVSSLAY
jgi:hypothetical protein